MYKILFYLFFMVFSVLGFSQIKKDSVITPPLPKDNNLLNVSSPKDHSPTRAAMLSMALPGLGQIYNANAYESESTFKNILRYGKVPIIYGLGGFFVYNVVQRNQLYTSYQQTLYDRQRPNYSGTDEFTGRLTDDDLRTRKDQSKKFRDNNIIYLVILYTATILDASVEAHLIDFKISESLIMTCEPTIINTSFAYERQNNIGIALKLHIK